MSLVLQTINRRSFTITEKVPSRGLLRDYEPSRGPSFQALVAYHTDQLQTCHTMMPCVRISGSPGRVVGELPECSQDMMTDFTKSYYQHFTPVREQ